MRNLHTELVCRADSADEFARLARAWLTEAGKQIAGWAIGNDTSLPALAKAQTRSP